MVSSSPVIIEPAWLPAATFLLGNWLSAGVALCLLSNQALLGLLGWALGWLTYPGCCCRCFFKTTFSQKFALSLQHELDWSLVWHMMGPCLWLSHFAWGGKRPTKLSSICWSGRDQIHESLRFIRADNISACWLEVFLPSAVPPDHSFISIPHCSSGCGYYSPVIWFYCRCNRFCCINVHDFDSCCLFILAGGPVVLDPF